MQIDTFRNYSLTGLKYMTLMPCPDARDAKRYTVFYDSVHNIVRPRPMLSYANVPKKKLKDIQGMFCISLEGLLKIKRSR